MLHLVTSLALARSGITQVSLPVGAVTQALPAAVRNPGLAGIVRDEGGCALPDIAVVGADPAWLQSTDEAVVPDDLRMPGGNRLWILGETSGTTAEPKQLGISHAMELQPNGRRVSDYSHRLGERFLSFTGVRFLSGVRRAMLCLGEGGTLALIPAGIGFRDLLPWIDRHGIAYVNCVPVHLHHLLNQVGVTGPRFPAWRVLRCGAAAISAGMVNDVRTRLSPNLYIQYSTTETGPLTTATPDMLDRAPDTVGRPVEGVELMIVDDDGHVLPPGQVGNVGVRLAEGRQSIPFAAEDNSGLSLVDGWHTLGDRGVLDAAGLLFLRGRADDVMNFDGMLISPYEIEAALCRHPAVREVAAFAIPSPEHQNVPAVAIVSPQPLSTAELVRYCAEHLGARAPQLFFQFGGIPRNPRGKVLRRELVRIALQHLKQAKPE